MPEKFQNKYRIESNRWQNWDYGWNGAYFITIVTHNRINYFGEIKNGEMIKSKLGLILNNEWLKTPNIRPDMNIVLDEYCVMPNHFHAIIIIGENQYNRDAMHRAPQPRPQPRPPKNPATPIIPGKINLGHNVKIYHQ